MSTKAEPAMGPIRKLLLPFAVAVVALIVLLKLGFWQLDRLAWKETLIVQVEEGIAKTPVAAPAPAGWQRLDEADDYRHVAVSGTFLPGTAFYYTALSDPAGPFEGPGVMAYAPFKTAEGWIVLVNRGFLPQGLPDDLRAQALQVPEGQMRLTGLLRLSEVPNWTTPAPGLDDNIWFARDTRAMGAVLGLDPGALPPYSIDLDAAFTPPGGLPQAGETIVSFKNDHLGYALTWFGLAATLVGVFLTYAAGVVWPRARQTD
ncbi:SURF1 family protein [Roseibium sp.]|uniref:SURF1 family protein n=1 Tax=Roseibium sp. TaxID=1936156 RepID=UPI0032643566